MPYFDDYYAAKLRGSLGRADAEAILDLRAVSREKAEASIADMLQRSRFAARKSVAVLIDPATPTSGETLFQPVGRLLLDAKKRGWIERLHPLPARDGAGFYVVLAGKPARDEEKA
ncbi:hypothetical protein QNA08_08935 [Chelatococcus sp. SYSU_G07232]|uniref:Uncharacterized protein n=1 Tax=Chelatococcus albus TaxID=3047466 RepID=A0ABT7AG78_9HYPH|nr:hypothetical protein [Chelatococcus sp. SYSU_G07232]MDJ1158356.1 hypothetical protein [Chelatococcus sp. SYSU_G07232]